MREIKFRGRDRELFLWRYGDLDTKSSPDLVSIIDDCDYSVDPDTVGQFTGLKDADGREIYEGDVIRVCGSNGIVVYSEGAFIVRFEKSPSLLSHCVGGDFSNPERVSACRVIGNVYDNPGLLEVEHD